MTAVAQLRTDRWLWRCCGTVIGGRSGPRTRVPRRGDPRQLLWFAPFVFIAIVWFAVAPDSAVIAAVVLVAVLVVGGYLLLAGLLWWATGAGAPVLEVADGEIRARLRPAYRRRPLWHGDPDWWDLRIAATDVVAVRLARTDRAFRQQLLALDLAPHAAESLLHIPDLDSVTRRMVQRAGTPAAWPAPAMRPLRRRRREVHNLIAAIEGARTAPTSS